MQSTHFAEKLSKTDSQMGEIKSKFKNTPSYLNGKTSAFSRLQKKTVRPRQLVDGFSGVNLFQVLRS